jgi:hypothetical protein
MTYLDDIERAFINLGGDAPYDDLYREVGRIRGRALTEVQKGNVRLTIQRHSKDSEMDERRKRPPYIFRSIGGLGSGHWGVRTKGGSERD